MIRKPLFANESRNKCNRILIRLDTETFEETDDH